MSNMPTGCQPLLKIKLLHMAVLLRKQGLLDKLENLFFIENEIHHLFEVPPNFYRYTKADETLVKIRRHQLPKEDWWQAMLQILHQWSQLINPSQPPLSKEKKSIIKTTHKVAEGWLSIKTAVASQKIKMQKFWAAHLQSTPTVTKSTSSDHFGQLLQSEITTSFTFSATTLQELAWH